VHTLLADMPAEVQWQTTQMLCLAIGCALNVVILTLPGGWTAEAVKHPGPHGPAAAAAAAARLHPSPRNLATGLAPTAAM
jgi:hypothetical protein